MLFFRNNKSQKQIFDKGFEVNPLFKYFCDGNRDELVRLANEISVEARDLFEGCTQGLLGQLPDGLADIHINLSKDTLAQLLFSAMTTGYLAKSAENKLSLERHWQNDLLQYREENSIDRFINSMYKKDDLDQIL